MAAKIRKGDKVIVLSGRDKGRTGEVFEVRPTENKALASSSVRAVVQTVTSIPQVSPILSKSISGKMMCSLMPSE